MLIRAFTLLGAAAVCIIASLLPSVTRAEAPLPEAPKKSEVIASGGKLMPGEQVKKMYLGNTVYHFWLVTYRGYKRGGFGPAFSRDERHRILTYNGRKIEILWWMEGDAACNEMLDGANRGCALTYELNGHTFSCNRDEDICRLMLRVVPGNVENL